eukprot:4575156-Prymnesium_polylepis.1
MFVSLGFLPRGVGGLPLPVRTLAAGAPPFVVGFGAFSPLCNCYAMYQPRSPRLGAKGPVVLELRSPGP